MRIDLLGGDGSEGAIPYSLNQFEQDVQNFRPRLFDTYILPGFILYYAYKSKGMRRNARRILFTSGIYMMYRNYSEYKKAAVKMQEALALVKKEGADE